MSKSFSVLLFLAALVLCACDAPSDVIQNNKSTEITVNTGGAFSVTDNSAILYGRLSSSTIVNGAEYGIILSSMPSPTFDNGTKHIAYYIDNYNEFKITINDLSPATTYYYRAYVNTSTYKVGDVKQFTTKEPIIIAVDLGLSVKWANHNLDAVMPEEGGSYYAWGETMVKTTYTWETYTWCQGSLKTLTKYNFKSTLGIVDYLSTLTLSDDVAHTKLGDKWRIPTKFEMDELISTKKNANYRWERKTISNHFGFEITCLVNGNSIFIPAAGIMSGTGTIYDFDTNGYYWTSSLYIEGPYSGWSMFVGQSALSIYTSYLNERRCGLSIRPVSD